MWRCLLYTDSSFGRTSLPIRFVVICSTMRIWHLFANQLPENFISLLIKHLHLLFFFELLRYYMWVYCQELFSRCRVNETARRSCVSQPVNLLFLSQVFWTHISSLLLLLNKMFITGLKVDKIKVSSVFCKFFAIMQSDPLWSNASL